MFVAGLRFSIQMMNKAMMNKVAQESGDHICVAFSLLWLYKIMDGEASFLLYENILPATVFFFRFSIFFSFSFQPAMTSVQAQCFSSAETGRGASSNLM
jgi:hypothetical protein